MSSLERFHQSRTVVEDFSTHTLRAISTVFGRLYYTNSLRDADLGRYVHEGLSAVYSEGAVQEGLTECHEELFCKVLETPLSEQAQDLHYCLRAAGEGYWELLDEWRENHTFRGMCPEGAPDYLHDLFCSNLNVLLAIFAARNRPS
jgi:hypothetical protein